MKMTYVCQWWGYRDIDGTLLAFRWFHDPLKLTEARSSYFVDQVADPFIARDRADALKKLEKLV